MTDLWFWLTYDPSCTAAALVVLGAAFFVGFLAGCAITAERQERDDDGKPA